MAMTDVIRMKELSRLRVCAGENCERLVVDLSKNRSRRYCEGPYGPPQGNSTFGPYTLPYHGWRVTRPCSVPKLSLQL